MPVVSFGGTHNERLEIDVSGYERAQPVGEYYDDNWLRVNVAVAAGGFRGKFGATFLVSELIGLRDELTKLHSSLKGSAALETMEGQLVSASKAMVSVPSLSAVKQSISPVSEIGWVSICRLIKRRSQIA